MADVFDSNGYVVPVFSSANVVNYESELFAYSPAGEVAIGNVFGVTHGATSMPTQMAALRFRSDRE